MDRIPLGGLVAKIISFGDSFILGNELQREDGFATWPGLIAKDLGVDYETTAEAGCGNENIAQQIYRYFTSNTRSHTLAVINWTWTMRWDFYLGDAKQWITLGPTCVPGKLEHLIGHGLAAELIDFYHRYTGKSDVWNRWRSLQAIYGVQCWLDRLGVPSVQTYIDPSLLSPAMGTRLQHYQAFRDPSWPDVVNEIDLDQLPPVILKELNSDYQSNLMPDHVQTLQDLVRPSLQTFEGMTFLDWSAAHGWPITDLLHPLEQAHRAAADLWRPVYVRMLES